MHIVMYGPEGAGKGTQAKLLSQKLKIPILTSGDLVREAAETDQGIIGDTCRKALSEGKYVPDSEMFVLWKRRLKRDDARDHWIMDGFPRNVRQAKFLDSKLKKYGYKIEKVFFLELSEQESYKRLLKRARPLHEGTHELHDSPERIKNRLDIYRKLEAPLLKYYGDQEVLFKINADQSVEKVHKDIMSHVV